MLQKKTVYKQSIQHTLVAWGLMLLLLFAQSEAWVWHPFLHADHHHEHHAAAAEQDACHRAIFHHDTINGCEHPAHLSQPTWDCELCDFLWLPMTWEDITQTLQIHPAFHKFLPSWTERLLGASVMTILTRATCLLFIT
ncbi:MAG: hypothetical protein R2795_20580 [Saprospiraceae bacterium]